MFCGTCTQQRLSLRGQGDSPVRICEPCKKIEEAARFELCHGYKNRAAKGIYVPIVILFMTLLCYLLVFDVKRL